MYMRYRVLCQIFHLHEQQAGVLRLCGTSSSTARAWAQGQPWACPSCDLRYKVTLALADLAPNQKKVDQK